MAKESVKGERGERKKEREREREGEREREREREGEKERERHTHTHTRGSKKTKNIVPYMSITRRHRSANPSKAKQFYPFSCVGFIWYNCHCFTLFFCIYICMSKGKVVKCGRAGYRISCFNKPAEFDSGSKTTLTETSSPVFPDESTSLLF